MSEGNGLPEGWVKTSLVAATQLVTGNTPSTKRAEFYGGSIPFVKPGDLDGEQPLLSASQNVTVEGAAAGRLLPPGAVLVSCIGNLGKTAILGTSAICNQQINAVIPPSNLESLYLYYYCRTLRDWMEQNASATTVTILNKSRFGEAPLLLPPLNEQRRIVTKIEALQERSAAAKEALDAIPPLLERFRQSVLAAAFRGDLTKDWRAKNPDVEPASVLLERIRKERKARFIEDTAEKARAKADAKATQAGKPWTDANNETVLAKERSKAEKKYKAPEPVDTTDLPELPEGWCWARLDEMLSYVTSGSRGWAAYYSDSGATFIRAQDIKTDELLLDGVAYVTLPQGVEGRRTLVAPHDLLVTITGANVTKAALVPPEIPEAYVSQHVALCRPCLAETAPLLHLWVISGANGRKQLLEAAYGGGKPGLNLDNIRSVLIALPPAAEQELVRQQVTELMNGCEDLAHAHKGAANIYGSLNQSILAKAFRGELVPQDPSDEPASVLLERIRAERAQAEAEKKAAKKRGRKRA